MNMYWYYQQDIIVCVCLVHRKPVLMSAQGSSPRAFACITLGFSLLLMSLPEITAGSHAPSLSTNLLVSNFLYHLTSSTGLTISTLLHSNVDYISLTSHLINADNIGFDVESD